MPAWARTFAGRVRQLITGSTGLDEWEWGVTLFSHNTQDIKEIVYEMRFDEVSALYRSSATSTSVCNSPSTSSSAASAF